MRGAGVRFIASLGELDPFELRDLTHTTAPNVSLFLAEHATLAPAAPQKPAELSWWDWTTFLLHTAAEIEHSLMIQYLYAAYSLSDGPYKGSPPANAIQLARKW